MAVNVVFAVFPSWNASARTAASGGIGARLDAVDRGLVRLEPRKHSSVGCVEPAPVHAPIPVSGGIGLSVLAKGCVAQEIQKTRVVGSVAVRLVFARTPASGDLSELAATRVNARTGR